MLRGFKQFNFPEIEEKVLKFWKENHVFEKSLALRQVSADGKPLADKQGKKAKNFRFFEGPPTANGMPGMHHVLARAFKDIILRYKTMRGYYVLRKAGWDTHGLPVEIEVEKALGIKNKQEIEKFGIAEFNARAKASVWKYKTEWEKLTERIGFWLDFSDPYITYDNKYIESLWWVLGQIAKSGLLKKLYKVVPWCPRCQTSLSSHELGQPGVYKKTKDPSIYVKFALRQGRSTELSRSPHGKRAKTKEFLLVWTTTPWTLPANVAVAVNPQLTYTKYKVDDEYFWSFSTPPSLGLRRAKEGKKFEIEVIEKLSGKKLVGLEYEPLYKEERGKRKEERYKVLGADFVSTEEGTGLVHIAPAFGEDDLRVFQEEKGKRKEEGELEIPVTIDDRGMVNKGLPGAGKFIKEADGDIIADLQKRGLLYSSGTIEHDYPFCWRCSNLLIYFARNSWFIEMSKLRNELMAANKKINWIPSHIKEGRFGEWLKDLKDWSISRERYWGTPLPVWEHQKQDKCKNKLVIGSFADLNKYRYSQNIFFITRHAESTHNLNGIIASGVERGKSASRVTKKGIEQAGKMGAALKKREIDIIYCSPYLRTKQTAKIIAKIIGAKIIFDKRIGELNTGVFNGRLVKEYEAHFADPLEKFTKTPPGGENLTDVKRRMFAFLYDINQRHNGKNILIISHGDPLWVLEGAAKGLANEEILKLSYPEIGEFHEISLANWPYNGDAELDLHRPFIDEITLRCPECGGEMKRIREVVDVWFDSGAMPFAQWHYPFENKEKVDKGLQFPADYIAEGMDQTRGWFYTMLAISVLLKRGVPYHNVISFGLLLDKYGQKMSKSKGNVVDPWAIIQKYGADVIRWHFYTINNPGEPKKFDEQDLAKTLRRVFLILYNSFVFWSTYADQKVQSSKFEAQSALDRWIMARLHQTILGVTQILEKYEVGDAGRTIESFIDDLSRWYIRRSRGIFQDAARGGSASRKQWQSASATLHAVLLELSKMLAPFTPFFSEAIYQSVNYESGIMNQELSKPINHNPKFIIHNSVHLTDWPKADKKLIDKELLDQMAEVRRLIGLALAEREKAGIKVRQPLSKLKVSAKGGSLPAVATALQAGASGGKSLKLKAAKELLELLKDEVNVKEVTFDNKISGKVEFDTKITPELRNEGVMRELARLVQGLRHDANYQLKDKIFLMIEAPEELLKIARLKLADFKKETNSKEVEFKKSVKFDAELNSKVENWPIWLGVRK